MTFLNRKRKFVSFSMNFTSIVVPEVMIRRSFNQTPWPVGGKMQKHASSVAVVPMLRL
jgi:hypothetical protein